MASGKYSVKCKKLSYASERQAWEHVIYYKRKDGLWQKPYHCGCGKWHLTAKQFDGRLPVWVYHYAGSPSRKERKRKEKTMTKILPLAEQRKIYELLRVHNSKRVTWWQRIIRGWKKKS